MLRGSAPAVNQWVAGRAISVSVAIQMRVWHQDTADFALSVTYGGSLSNNYS